VVATILSNNKKKKKNNEEDSKAKTSVNKVENEKQRIVATPKDKILKAQKAFEDVLLRQTRELAALETAISFNGSKQNKKRNKNVKTTTSSKEVLKEKKDTSTKQKDKESFKVSVTSPSLAKMFAELSSIKTKSLEQEKDTVRADKDKNSSPPPVLEAISSFFGMGGTNQKSREDENETKQTPPPSHRPLWNLNLMLAPRSSSSSSDSSKASEKSPPVVRNDPWSFSSAADAATKLFTPRFTPQRSATRVVRRNTARGEQQRKKTATYTPSRRISSRRVVQTSATRVVRRNSASGRKITKIIPDKEQTSSATTTVKKEQPFSFFGNNHNMEPFSFFGGGSSKKDTTDEDEDDKDSDSASDFWNEFKTSTVRIASQMHRQTSATKVVRRNSTNKNSRHTVRRNTSRGKAPNDDDVSVNDRVEEKEGLFSFFGNHHHQSMSQNDIPIIKEWKMKKDGSITGHIYNSPDFYQGQYVTTSPLKGDSIVKAGSIATTNGGSKYHLM